MKRLTTISLLCATLSAATNFGPPVGSRFPATDVPLGPKGAAILFSGSQNQLAELEAHREAFHNLGVGVATRNEFNGHAAPAGWFILDAQRKIVAKYFEDDSAKSYTSAAILVHQFGWMPPDTREVEGKQLTAVVGASNSTVAPGDRVALTLDIDLGPDMHVYAPGVENYIPIDWKMEDSSAAEVHAPSFPPPKKLFLKAIAETVPAYRGHFRLVRDITIGPGAFGQFSVDGSLRYQACDDRVCYIPQTLRLHWSFEGSR
jgi:Disulphide bond corrector protein DsbC